MPNEKFYDPSVSEDDLPTPPVAKVFNVAWGPQEDVVRICGVGLDKSGLDRLLATLRRAERQMRSQEPINVPARLIVEDGVLYVVSQAALDAWTRRAMQPRLGAPLWPSGVALEEISELAVSMFGGHVLKNRYGMKEGSR